MHQEPYVYLVLDYAEHGNLYSYIHKKKHLTESEIFKFFYQTTLAIDYLHKNNIMHRDIKPENLLLDKDYNIKLCDFGWSTQNINDKRYGYIDKSLSCTDCLLFAFRLTFCGTYEYMAPEIVNKTPYDYRIDIWSLGILLYELHHREAPYKGRTLNEITKSLSKKSFHVSSSVHPEAKELIMKILKINPTERLSIQAILSHSWISARVNQSKPKRAASPQQSVSGKIVQNLQIRTEEDPRAPVKIMPATTTSHSTTVYDSTRIPHNIHTSQSGDFTHVISHSKSFVSNLPSQHHSRSKASEPEEKSRSYLIEGTTSPNSSSHYKTKDTSKYRICTQESPPKGKISHAMKSPSISQMSLGNLTTRDKENRDFMSFVTHQELMKRHEGSREGTRHRTLANQIHYPSTTTHKHTKTINSELSLDTPFDGKDRKASAQRNIFDSSQLSPTFKIKLNEIMNHLASKTTTHHSESEAKFSSSIFSQSHAHIAPVRVQSPNHRSINTTSLSQIPQVEVNNHSMQSTGNPNSSQNFGMKGSSSVFFTSQLPEENEGKQINTVNLTSSVNSLPRGPLTSLGSKENEMDQAKLDYSTSQKYLKDLDCNALTSSHGSKGIEFTDFYKGLDLKKRVVSPTIKGQRNKENEGSRIQKLLTSKGPLFKTNY